ncbi:MAG: ATP-dependent Clp protease ATP-binding subunit ClpX [Pseudomonadota bacterium]
MQKIDCSFCGKTQAEVRRLISGPNVYICDECILLCKDILEEEMIGGPASRYPKPSELLAHLDDYVIGQAKAKRVLSVAVYSHYKRINYRGKRNDVELGKCNVLLVGPTGCGKTLLAETLARELEVPFAVVDATALTEAGYVGEDVENIIKALLRSANGDVKEAARGIICIDEVDKLARRIGGQSLNRDVSGEGVQQALLKILEGRIATISPDGSRNRPQQELIQVDTTNILFFCCGSFDGIEEIIKSRIGKRQIGFGSETEFNLEDRNRLRSQINHEDLIRFGMIPEFMGRIPTVVPCDDLDVSSLIEILWRPKNALFRQYQRLFEMDGVQLRITDEAMHAVAEKAIQRKAGARGLRSVMESVMLDVMFELPSLENVLECLVDKEAVTEGTNPKLIREKKAS